MKKMGIFASLLCAALVMSSCGDDKDKTPSVPDTKPDVPEVTNHDVKVLTTTYDRQKDLEESYLTFSTSDNMSPSTIRLNPNETFQTMDGFGAAITGSTCYNLMRMSPELRKEFLELTFSPTNGYGFSYVRIAIGCSDFSLSEFTCCDKPGIENFALPEEDVKYIIPVLKEILALNPTIKIMGSPWTPPRWMKVNNLTDKKAHNQWTSGSLNPDYYKDYATYFVKWIQAYRDNGIKIYSITPQNEPLNRGNSASCYMPWEEERDFVKTALGPAFAAAGIDTKIYAFDHNYNYDNIQSQQQYPVKIYADEEAKNYLAGAAYHNYGGNKDELTAVHNAAPGMDLVFSETSIGTWNDGRNLATRLPEDMREVALGTVNRWAKGVIVWNLMLDEDRGPNRPGGCQTCDGAVNINREYTKITRNSHYYIIAHLSSVVKPGAVRIGTSGYTQTNMNYSAFRNADGTYALVINNNNNDAKRFVVDDGTHHFTVNIPAHSATSLSWK